MTTSAILNLLLSLAWRNLKAHRVKSLIVGMLLSFGTALVVTGSALLDSVEGTMRQSITSSVAGDLQVYAADAKDPLALFGSLAFGQPDIGEIGDFPAIEKQLLAIPGVKAVVPMGMAMPTVFGRSELDGLLERMRDAVRAGDTAAAARLVPQIRQIAADLRKEIGYRLAISSNPAALQGEEAVLSKVDSDEFWVDFSQNPTKVLDFLDFELAPISPEGKLVYFRTLGTDLAQFSQNFDRFRVVDGQMVPEGKRGFLIAKDFYEDFIKNKVAREFDDIRREVTEKGGTIAATPGLSDQVARMSRQYQRILFQLSPADAAELETKLRPLLYGQSEGERPASVAALIEKFGEEPDLSGLLQAFLLVDDNNVQERHDFFYKEIAPHIQLYDIPVGSVVTMRSFTKSGYVRSVNVKIYGTFQFEGLERSDLAGALNLTDMVTFRDLYGKMTSDQQAELKDIQAQVGVQDVSRADAEAALFGGGGSLESTAGTAGFDEFAGADISGRRSESPDDRSYTPEQIREGLALNAAIILDDPAKQAAVMAAINAIKDQTGLQVVGWEQASGIVGQFIVVIRLVLYVAIFIIFLVALVIINNTMVMATMERTFEIGTMRAIGAQKGFVMMLFLIETLLLGLIAGSAGAAFGVLLIQYLGVVGIPAPADVLVVLFAGPRLYPHIQATNVLFGMGVVSLISLLSTFYPSRIAAGISPVVAMSGKE